MNLTSAILGHFDSHKRQFDENFSSSEEKDGIHGKGLATIKTIVENMGASIEVE